MSRFLVTGGAGFIGSHITERLLKYGHFVRVLDNLSSGKRQNLVFSQDAKRKGQYEFIKGDIRTFATCLKAVRGVEYVLHQAALRSVPRSMNNPAEYNEVNIGGTLNMLEASLRNKVKGFVFASSSSVYGDVVSFPQKEDFLPQPISPYALSKLTGEHYCKIFSLHYGLATVALRYFNVFGPRQALDDEYAVVIPKFITCMLRDEHPPIFGNGLQSRDFTFIANVVGANCLAVKYAASSAGGVYNVASGKNYSVLELVKILNGIMKKNIQPDFLKPRRGDVFKTLADLTRSKKMLKFTPLVDFIAGLGITVGYFKKKYDA
jgi:nucleoside-diphosphate-sugar epimerase